MPVHVLAVEIDARHPSRQAEFWSKLLQRERDGLAIPDGGSGFAIRFAKSRAPKVRQNRIHFDLTTKSADDYAEFVDRAIRLGGRLVDIGQSADDKHEVLVDPEGNEFCIIDPSNRYLADTDLIGAVNCDGSRALGLFWAAALGWPLVWDQDEETAIQSPAGGSKIQWNGPPLQPRGIGDRVRLVVQSTDSDRAAGFDHLVVLGATVEGDSDDPVIHDPEGNLVVFVG